MADFPLHVLEDARRFLETLDPEAARFSFMTRDDKGDDSSLSRSLHGIFGDVVGNLIALNKRGAAISVLVHETDLQGTGKHHFIKRGNIVRCRTMFCDWDDKSPPRGSGALPLSMVVSRKDGAHKRTHGYWRIEHTTDLERWQLAQKALVDKLEADKGAIVLTQALRIPGFFNCKATPIRVDLEQCEPKHIYTLDEVIETYQLQPLIDKILEPPKPRRPRKEGDGEGPADDYKERGDWSILEQHGWELIDRDGGEGRWRRPGKRRKGVSATTDHLGRTGMFKCFSSSAPPFEADKAYTRFQVYTLLKCGGLSSSDYKQATKDLVAQGFGKSNSAAYRKEIAEHEDAAFQASIDAGPPPAARRRGPKPMPDPPDRFDEVPDHTDDDAPGETVSVAQPSSTGNGGNGKGRRGRKKTSKRGAANDGSTRVFIDKSGTKDPQDHFGLNFRVSKLTKYDSDPPIYHLEIDGSKMLRLKADTLMSLHKFRIRFAEIINKVPNLPQEKEDWFVIVNYWFSIAEIIKQPEEASLVGRIRTELRDLLRGLAIGEVPEDLDHGHILPHPKLEDTFMVKQSTLHTILRDKLGSPVDADTMGEQLRQLNADYARVRIGGHRPCVWTFKQAMDDPEGVPQPAGPLQLIK